MHLDARNAIDHRFERDVDSRNGAFGNRAPGKFEILGGVGEGGGEHDLVVAQAEQIGKHLEAVFVEPDRVRKVGGMVGVAGGSAPSEQIEILVTGEQADVDRFAHAHMTYVATDPSADSGEHGAETRVHASAEDRCCARLSRSGNPSLFACGQGASGQKLGGRYDIDPGP